MIKTFCVLLTVIMLCFTNVCTATDWTWVNSDGVSTEYIDLNSIEPKIYVGEPKQVSAWVKIENNNTHKREVMKLTFDYNNRLIYLTQRRVDDIESGITEKQEHETIIYPVTVRFLNLTSDFYWYVKDKFTGRDDFIQFHSDSKRLMLVDTYTIRNQKMYECIDVKSIQANDNLIQVDVVIMSKDSDSGFVGIEQYTKDGKKMKRFKKLWRPSEEDGTLVLTKTAKDRFEDVYPDSMGELEFKLLMKYYKEHPENIGKNALK